MAALATGVAITVGADLKQHSPKQTSRELPSNVVAAAARVETVVEQHRPQLEHTAAAAAGAAATNIFWEEIRGAVHSEPPQETGVAADAAGVMTVMGALPQPQLLQHKAVARAKNTSQTPLAKLGHPVISTAGGVKELGSRAALQPSQNTGTGVVDTIPSTAAAAAGVTAKAAAAFQKQFVQFGNTVAPEAAVAATQLPVQQPPLQRAASAGGARVEMGGATQQRASALEAAARRDAADKELLREIESVYTYLQEPMIYVEIQAPLTQKEMRVALQMALAQVSFLKRALEPCGLECSGYISFTAKISFLFSLLSSNAFNNEYTGLTQQKIVQETFQGIQTAALRMFNPIYLLYNPHVVVELTTSKLLLTSLSDAIRRIQYMVYVICHTNRNLSREFELLVVRMEKEGLEKGGLRPHEPEVENENVAQEAAAQPVSPMEVPRSATRKQASTASQGAAAAAKPAPAQKVATPEAAPVAAGGAAAVSLKRDVGVATKSHGLTASQGAGAAAAAQPVSTKKVATPTAAPVVAGDAAAVSLKRDLGVATKSQGLTASQGAGAAAVAQPVSAKKVATPTAALVAGAGASVKKTVTAKGQTTGASTVKAKPSGATHA